MNNSSNSRREALRAQKEAEAKRKRINRILIVAFAVAAVVIAGFVAFFIIQEATKPTPAVDNKGNFTPPNASDGHGVKVAADKAKNDAPEVVIWEDFQCGHCKTTEDAYGKLFDGLAEKGKISLEYRFVPMLDRPGTDRSLKTASAAVLADKYGKFSEYRDEVFANYGDYTDELLRDAIPEKIGLTEEQRTEFAKLYDAGAAEKFAKDAMDQFMSDGISGTPTILVDGKQVESLWTEQGPAAQDEEGLLKLLKP